MSPSILTKLEVARQAEAAAYLPATPPSPAPEPPSAQAVTICREAGNCGLFQLFAAVTLESEPAERIGRMNVLGIPVEEGTTRSLAEEPRRRSTNPTSCGDVRLAPPIGRRS
jgi:hypothetical protein